MADADQKFEVLLYNRVERTILAVETLLQAPVADGTMLRPDEAPALRSFVEPTVFDAILPVVSMKEVRPSDCRRDDEQLRLELDLRIVEDLDSGEHRLTRLLDELGRYGPEPPLSFTHFER